MRRDEAWCRRCPRLAGEVFYNTCARRPAAAAAARLGPQRAASLKQPATVAAWRSRPNTYIRCAQDRANSPACRTRWPPAAAAGRADDRHRPLAVHLCSGRAGRAPRPARALESRRGCALATTVPAMRLLHTGDWHVGKSLRGRDRLDEQAAVLEELVAVADASDVGLVLVAGDLFDVASPPPEAERLVYRALLDLAAGGRQVVVVAGNHDGPGRLAAVAPLAARANVTVAGGVRPPAEGGVLHLDVGGEEVRLALLPWMSPRYVVDAAALLHLDADQHQQAFAVRVAQVVAALCASFEVGTVNLLLGHLHAAGGTLGGGERLAHTVLDYAVSAVAFPAACQYVALGHLHRRQRIDGPCPVWYPGSPLALDFGETEDPKGALVVEVAGGRPAVVEPVALSAGRRLRTLVGSMAELRAQAGTTGSDLLRVFVEEPGRAGLADEVRDLFPDALDVRLGAGPTAAGASSGSWAGATAPPAMPPASAAARVEATPVPPPTGAPAARPRSCSPATSPSGTCRIRASSGSSLSCSRRRPGRAGRMRPERLVLEGFTAFRQRTDVDFRDADLFALWGPTGAGKSSLIDAMVFALYGSVPRYANKSLVSPVISQGELEARVLLQFSVGAEHFVVARVVRADGRGGASTREARLERLVPASIADAGDLVPGELLAGDADAVTRAVETLLGLNFEHFTTCVVLPQGDFARFLHQVPRERQALLIRLLDLSVYAAMATSAGERAKLARVRRELQSERLAELADRTPEQRDVLQRRRDELGSLLTDLDGAGPERDRLVSASEEARARAASAGAWADRLGELRAPDALAHLGADLDAAAAGLDTSSGALERAEAAVAEASAAVAGQPPRAELEVLLDRHDQRADAAAAADLATAALAEAAATAGIAGAAEATARELAAVAESEFDAAQAELTRREAALAAGAGAAELEAVLRRHEELEKLAERLDKGRGVLTADRRGLDAAQAELGRASAAVDSAQQRLEAVRNAERAADLAAGLQAGDTCPVCGQTVGHLATRHDAGQRGAAQVAVEEAKARRAVLESDVAERGRNLAAAEELFRDLEQRSAGLRDELAPHGSPGQVAGELQQVRAAEQARRVRGRGSGGGAPALAAGPRRERARAGGPPDRRAGRSGRAGAPRPPPHAGTTRRRVGGPARRRRDPPAAGRGPRRRGCTAQRHGRAGGGAPATGCCPGRAGRGLGAGAGAVGPLRRGPRRFRTARSTPARRSPAPRCSGRSRGRLGRAAHLGRRRPPAAAAGGCRRQSRRRRRRPGRARADRPLRGPGRAARRRRRRPRGP